MDKQQMVHKTEEFLRPFETENLGQFVRHLSIQSIMENKWLAGVLALLLVIGIVRKSKLILLTLLGLVGAGVLLAYGIPPDGVMTVNNILMLAGGGLALGGTIIYFGLIR